MLEKDTNTNNQVAERVYKIPQLNSVLNRPLWLGFMAFIILSLLFTLLIFQRYQLAHDAREKEAYKIVNGAKEKLQEALTHSLAVTKTLTFFIDKNGTVNNFDSIAGQVLESARVIDGVELVPDGVIRYVYPLAGNEKVIGYNILKDPARNKEAFKAIEKKKMFFAGPILLRQGGVGVVGRLPVFRNNTFWGFSAVVIKMSTLYKTAGIDSTGINGYYYQLSKINPDTKLEQFFLPKLKDEKNSYTVSVNVPDGESKLSVTRASADGAFGDIGLLALLGFLLSVLAAISIYRFALRPGKLNELVLNRTRELEKSENNYRSLIERVSDAFVALNKKWEYTYVNEKAGEILARDPQSLVGKNIWIEFPGGEDEPFYYAYKRAMNTQNTNTSRSITSLLINGSKITFTPRRTA